MDRMVLLRFCPLFMEPILVQYNSAAIPQHDRMLPGYQHTTNTGEYYVCIYELYTGYGDCL